VGVVRVSGPQAETIGLSLSGRNSLRPRYCHFATFRDASGQPLDEGLLVYFPSPHSFTGEDVVEFHGHGGPAVLQGLLKGIYAAGAEAAGPGEFTRRAYLNDRMDLAQAEAVAQLIEADHESGARAALRSLEGEFGRLVDELTEELTQLRMFVEGALDFPDEDVDFLAEGHVDGRLQGLLQEVARIRRRAAQGVRLGQGFSVVLAGRPNAGKSSLLNRLSGRESAIVTARAGTTRDVLRESVEIQGFPVELVDTAGLRETTDIVEQEGVRRTRDQVARADLILYLVDSLAGWTAEDAAEWESLPPERRALLWSKADLTEPPLGEVGVAANGDGPGVDPLLELLGQRLTDGPASDALGARERHLEILDRVHGHLTTAAETLAMHGSGDLTAQDLRWAQEALGEITGRIHSDDLLGRIFSSFCIGK
jgi:tRNA modification GTPase